MGSFNDGILGLSPVSLSLTSYYSSLGECGSRNAQRLLLYHCTVTQTQSRHLAFFTAVSFVIRF